MLTTPLSQRRSGRSGSLLHHIGAAWPCSCHQLIGLDAAFGAHVGPCRAGDVEATLPHRTEVGCFFLVLELFEKLSGFSPVDAMRSFGAPSLVRQPGSALLLDCLLEQLLALVGKVAVLQREGHLLSCSCLARGFPCMQLLGLYTNVLHVADRRAKRPRHTFPPVLALELLPENLPRSQNPVMRLGTLQQLGNRHPVLEDEALLRVFNPFVSNVEGDVDASLRPDVLPDLGADTLTLMAPKARGHDTGVKESRADTLVGHVQGLKFLETSFSLVKSFGGGTF